MKKSLGLILILSLVFLSLVLVRADNSSDVEKFDILSKEIKIPQPIQPILKIFFNINEIVLMEDFIILLAIFLMLFIIISNTLVFIPFFNKTWQRVGIGIIITLIIGLTGTINYIADFFIKSLDFFKFINLGPLRIVIALIIALIIIFSASFVIRTLHKKYILESASLSGSKLANAVKISEIMSEDVE